mgnify:CR=1 FL=1
MLRLVSYARPREMPQYRGRTGPLFQRGLADPANSAVAGGAVKAVKAGKLVQCGPFGFEPVDRMLRVAIAERHAGKDQRLIIQLEERLDAVGPGAPRLLRWPCRKPIDQERLF